MRFWWIIWVTVLALGLAACADDTEPDVDADPEATEEPVEEPTEEPIEEPTEDPEAVGDAATVSTAEAGDFGEVLVDGEGMSLYLFQNDEPDESTCYDDCAQTWPPLLTTGEPTAEGEADAALLGTTERDDGTTQVTYDGQPLYTYAADSAPGDTSGQGVGDVWWLVDPAGDAIEE